MIFLTVGNAHPRFHRLVDGADEIAKATGQEVYVQHGHTPGKFRIAKGTAFLKVTEYEHWIDRSTIVVSHAGAGTIIASLAAKKRLIVMPRRLEFSEHVNDHQIEIAEQLSQEGAIEVVHSIDELLRIIVRPKADAISEWSERRPPLLDCVESWINSEFNT